MKMTLTARREAGSQYEKRDDESPRYRHDCAYEGCCRFYGQIGGADFWMTRRSSVPSIILRYSDDGPDYRITPIDNVRRDIRFFAQHQPEYVAALAMYDAAQEKDEK